jgi:hypothetical protein
MDFNSNRKRPETRFAKSKLYLYREAKSVYGYNSVKPIANVEAEEKKNNERKLKCVENKAKNSLCDLKLGPGRYESISPTQSISHSFSALPRFSNNTEFKFSIRKDKSPIASIESINKRIDINKERILLTSESKQKLILEHRRMREINIKLAIETKSQIYNENLAKKHQVLEMKSLKQRNVNKSEQKARRITIERSNRIWAVLISLFGMYSMIPVLYNRRASIKKSAFKHLSLLFYVSKFIGAMKRILIALKKKRGERWLKIYITPLLLDKMNELRLLKVGCVSHVVDFYVHRYAIQLTFSRLKRALVKIQEAIKSFLITRNARIEALGLLWKKMMGKNLKGQKEVQSHFITKYLNKRAKNYIDDLKEYWRNIEVNGSKHLKPMPTFTIYSKKNEFKAYMLNIGKKSIMKKRKSKKHDHK